MKLNCMDKIMNTKCAKPLKRMDEISKKIPLHTIMYVMGRNGCYFGGIPHVKKLILE